MTTPAATPAATSIAVAGATGTVGRHVVAVLRARGHGVVELSRARGVDLRRPAGAPIADVAALLQDCSAVIDCLNVATMARRESIAGFTSTTATLLAAGRAAEVPHHVALSIVGIDRAPTAYYAGKRAQERLVAAHGGAATILRATQFHEFAGQMAPALRRGPVLLAPCMRLAPVAASEVAEALVDLATGTPPSAVGGPRRLEMGGPVVHRFPDLVRRLGLPGRVVPIPYPGRGARAVAGGALLPHSPWRTGRETFEEWLVRSTAPERSVV